MHKRVALFWPADAREIPNEMAQPSIEETTRSSSARCKSSAAQPYLVEGFLSKPHEAIEKLGPIDDPMVGVCVHWFYAPAHHATASSARTTRCCSPATSRARWPGLVGLLNTGASLESVEPPVLARLDRRARLDADADVHGAARRVVLDAAASRYDEGEIALPRARSPPTRVALAREVADEIRQRRMLDPDARRHVDGHDQRLLRPAAAQPARLHRAQGRSGLDHRSRAAHRATSASTTRFAFVKDKGVDLPLGRERRDGLRRGARRASSSATTWRCSTCSTSSRPTASAGSTSSGSSRCGRRATSPRGCFNSALPPRVERRHHRHAPPRPTRATSCRWS